MARWQMGWWQMGLAFPHSPHNPTQPSPILPDLPPTPTLPSPFWEVWGWVWPNLIWKCGVLVFSSVIIWVELV